MKGLLNLFVSCLIGLYFLASCEGIDSSVVLLPPDYIGPVVIAYNVDSAAYPKSHLVPDSMGIIRVPYEDRFGSLDQVDFYYGTILASNKLNRYYDFQDFPKGEKAVYGGQSKVVLAGINGKGPKLKYTTYCIGYRQDINECYKVIENLLSAQ